MAETAAERKARIRKRLKEADTPQKDVTATVEAHTKPIDEDEGEDVPEAPSPNPPSNNVPSTQQIKERAIQRRQNKPTNYKVHVLSALGLAIVIRIAALGPKAVLGGK